MHHLTGGGFDPTVQPLWNLYASHFSRADADPVGPEPARIAASLSHVGWKKVAFDESRVALAPGTAVTLNGIAQGYITDRVCDLLRREGVGHTMVDMGELRALDTRPDGSLWQIGLENGKREANHTVEIASRAVATSAAAGTAFDTSGKFAHHFDPRTGAARPIWSSVSVIAQTATMADGLSTAFSMLPADSIQRIASHLDAVEVYVSGQDSGIHAL
jgi:thiamine biosynthesis lipoprotein